MKPDLKFEIILTKNFQIHLFLQVSSPQSPEICMNVLIWIFCSQLTSSSSRLDLNSCLRLLQMIVHLDPEENQPRRGEVGDQIHSVVPVVSVEDSSRTISIKLSGLSLM